MSRPPEEERREGDRCSRLGCPCRVPDGRDLYCSDRCAHCAAQRRYRARQEEGVQEPPGSGEVSPHPGGRADG